jgi:hypothetical protein
LVFDTLIGNTDRHHENWGLLATQNEGRVITWLSPTFDHASSLGCHEAEDNKVARLRTTDRNYTCSAYASKARSAFFDESGGGSPLKVLDALKKAVELKPIAAKAWLELIVKIKTRDLCTILEEVPPELISEVSKRFAAEMLSANRETLLGLLTTRA